MAACKGCDKRKPKHKLVAIRTRENERTFVCRDCLPLYRNNIKGKPVVIKSEQNLGRLWTRGYAGKKGLLLSVYGGGNILQEVLLENNETLLLYPSEFKVTDDK